MSYTDKLFDFDNVFSSGQMEIPLGELYQVAELSLIRDGIIGQHVQQCDEITYVVSGSCKVYSDDTCYDMNAGDVHFVKQGCEHRIVASSHENLRYICFAFFPNKTHPANVAFSAARAERSHFVIRDNGMVKTLSEYLVRELYQKDELSAEMLQCFLSQILITVSRILSGKTMDYREVGDKKSSYYAMYKLLRYLDNEYLQITSIKAVADKLSYSEYYLSHLFREKMGMTIKEYILKKKIAHGADLLKRSSLTVEEIAEQLNFSSSHAFRRAFKQIVSLTPSEYKNQK